MLDTDFTTHADSQHPSLWDDVARQYSDEPDSDELEVAADLESILSGLGVNAGSTLLEAGCGSGHISSYLASRGYQTTLLDFSSIALEKAKHLYKKNNLDGKFVYSDLFDLSGSSMGLHDVVWNSGVLEHFDGWQIIDAMQKMASATKKFIIIIIPNPKSTAYVDFRQKAMAKGVWQWGLEILRESLEDLARFSGLEVVEQRFVGQAHLKYFEEFASSKKFDDSKKITDDQKYLKVIVAKPVPAKLDLESKIELLLKIFKNDSSVLRHTYYSDVTVMLDNLKSLGVKANEDKVLIASLKNDLNSVNLEKSHLQKENSNLKASLNFEKRRVDALLNTKTWKLTQLYERKFQGNVVGTIIEKITDFVLRQSDAKTSAEDTGANAEKSRQKTLEDIKSIIEKSGNIKGIIVYPPTVDWNIPLFQRPHHMATNLARNNWLYFYCTTNAYDKVNGFENISENLYLTDKFDELVDALDSFFMFIHCAHPTMTIPQLTSLAGKATLIYDYLDEIHPSVSGLKPNDVLERHTYMMKNSTAVVATAGKLFSDVAELRNEGVFLLPNAVDYEHFHIVQDPKAMPKDIKSIRDSGGPILGYFGAIAKWFDYDLVKHVAKTNPEWQIVLIGWDYDNTISQSGIDKFENIHYLGIKKYDVLPSYAVWFDVCILPFVLNDITNSTSPIKLFEYMALGKPIVTTPIREVGSYSSPLVARNAEEFAEKIREALGVKDDPAYLDLVDGEAKANTWTKRFDDLDGILMSLAKH